MGWMIRTYSDHNDEMVRELDLDHLGPKDRPIDRAGSLFLGSSGSWHSYLDWDEKEESDVAQAAA